MNYIVETDFAQHWSLVHYTVPYRNSWTVITLKLLYLFLSVHSVQLVSSFYWGTVHIIVQGVFFFFSASVQVQHTLNSWFSDLLSVKRLSEQEACYYHTTVSMLEMGNALLVICNDLIWVFCGWMGQSDTPVRQGFLSNIKQSSWQKIMAAFCCMPCWGVGHESVIKPVMLSDFVILSSICSESPNFSQIGCVVSADVKTKKDADIYCKCGQCISSAPNNSSEN